MSEHVLNPVAYEVKFRYAIPSFHQNHNRTTAVIIDSDKEIDPYAAINEKISTEYSRNGVVFHGIDSIRKIGFARCVNCDVVREDTHD